GVIAGRGDGFAVAGESRALRGLGEPFQPAEDAAAGQVLNPQPDYRGPAIRRKCETTESRPNVRRGKLVRGDVPDAEALIAGAIKQLTVGREGQSNNCSSV